MVRCASCKRCCTSTASMLLYVMLWLCFYGGVCYACDTCTYTVDVEPCASTACWTLVMAQVFQCCYYTLLPQQVRIKHHNINRWSTHVQRLCSTMFLSLQTTIINAVNVVSKSNPERRKIATSKKHPSCSTYTAADQVCTITKQFYPSLVRCVAVLYYCSLCSTAQKQLTFVCFLAGNLPITWCSLTRLAGYGSLGTASCSMCVVAYCVRAARDHRGCLCTARGGGCKHVNTAVIQHTHTSFSHCNRHHGSGTGIGTICQGQEEGCSLCD